MHLHCFGDGTPHSDPWIQGRVRILEDDLQLAAQTAHLIHAQCGKVAALVEHVTGGGLDQSQDASAQRGLATTASSYKPKRFAGVDREGQVVQDVCIVLGPAEKTLGAGVGLVQPFHA
jgi:hypothetical protein